MFRNFDQKTLEEQYSPSSCIEDIDIYLTQYIQQSAAAFEYAEAGGSMIKNLQYGSDADEKIDLFIPIDEPAAAPRSRKLHIYIHGGYWQELTKEESAFAATNFQENGCYFAVLNYSLAPKVTLTEIIEQNRKAIAWLYDNAEVLGFDANEIYLSGSSAGAHLALMMTQTDWSKYCKKAVKADCLIKGVVAVSGIYDLTPIPDTYINKPLALTAKDTLNVSPIFYAQICRCPVIFAFGDNETSEFKRQSMEMAEHLRKQSIETELFEVANRNHFDVILDLGQQESELFKSAEKLMKLHF